MAALTRFSKTLSLLSRQRIVLQRVVSVRALGNSTDPPKEKAKDQGKTTTPNCDQGTYKVQEYFHYNPHSFYDMDMEMIKFRLEQPVPGTKY